jgi:hypothetical protein
MNVGLYYEAEVKKMYIHTLGKTSTDYCKWSSLKILRSLLTKLIQND